MSETSKYVWYANEKLNGLPLIFLTRDIRVMSPFVVSDTRSRNSKLVQLGTSNIRYMLASNNQSDRKEERKPVKVDIHVNYGFMAFKLIPMWPAFHVFFR